MNRRIVIFLCSFLAVSILAAAWWMLFGDRPAAEGPFEPAAERVSGGAAGPLVHVEVAGDRPSRERLELSGNKGPVKQVSNRAQQDLDAPFLPEQGAVLEGRVLGIASREPIAEARLRYHDPAAGIDRTALTSPEGRFRLCGLPAARPIEPSGLRWGKSRHFSCDDGPGPEIVSVGKDRYETVLFLEPGVPVSGRVLDARGRPAADVPVFAFDAARQSTRVVRARQDFGARILLDGMDVFADCVTRSDGEGFFTIPAAAPGLAITIAAIVPGHARAETAPIVFDCGEPVTGIVLRARHESVVAGTVRDESGAPVKSATVDLYVPEEVNLFPLGSRSAGRIRCAGVESTDPSGAFRFGGLSPGMFRLRAYRQGFGNVLSAWFSLEQNATVQKNFVLERGALSVTGCIRGCKGRPVGGMVVAFTPWPLPRDKSLTPFQCRSKQDGSFSVSGLWEGAPHLVNARDPEGKYIVVRNDSLPRLVLPGTDGIEFRAYHGAAISGRIENLPPGALPNLRVTMQGTAGDHRSRTGPAREGRFRVDRLLPGFHTVHVTGKGLTERIVGQVVLDEGERRDDLVFFYQGAIGLRGTVLSNADRSPCGAVRVTLVDRPARSPSSDRAAVSESITDTAGRFEFRGIACGRYDLVAWDLTAGRACVRGIDVVEGQEPLDITLRLLPGVRVAATVFRSDTYRPVRWTAVRFVDGDRAVRTTFTDHEGRFEIFLVPGTYVCAMESPDGQIDTRRIVVTEGEMTDLAIRF